MTIHRHKGLQTLMFLSLLAFTSCNSTKEKAKDSIESKEEKIEANSIDTSKIMNEVNLSEGTQSIDTLEIIVVQCANGYEYAMHNYNFNPVVENELNKFENIKVTPFPLKTLMGVTYQGVFDKKYCPPIIEKVDVDFLILTRFDKPYGGFNRNQVKWGYELRIVDTETLEQVNTISAHGLNHYSEIEKHIQENIKRLKKDIEKLKQNTL